MPDLPDPAAPEVAPPLRPAAPNALGLQWAGVACINYKPADTSFLDVTRQVLFGAPEGLPCQLRYFEVGPGGHSTLEQHAHVHGVVILYGQGQAFVGEQLFAVQPHDLVYVPPHTWHQFLAAPETPLGFLCLVATDRDRPVRPDAEARAALQALPCAAALRF